MFILFLFFWGGYALVQGELMGITGLLFGAVGSSYLYQDLKNFFGKPPEKMHWWYGHIASMGGSYIAATTAFIVVNFYIGQLNFILWVMPGVIGGFIIRSTIRKYKLQFDGAAARSRKDA